MAEVRVIQDNEEFDCIQIVRGQVSVSKRSSRTPDNTYKVWGEEGIYFNPNDSEIQRIINNARLRAKGIYRR